MSKSYLRKVRDTSQAKQKRGTIKRATKSGTEENYRLRRVTHLPLWQHLDLGVWNDQVQKVIAIGTLTHTRRQTHICTHTKLHTKHADTNTYLLLHQKKQKQRIRAY